MRAVAGVPGRRRGRPFAAVAVAAILSLAAPVGAEHPALVLHTSRNGLPQSQVTSAAQDLDGYLWIGTESGGLGGWNGHEWVVVDASQGLPSNEVRAVARASDGAVLVGTTGGAVRLVDGEIRPLPGGEGAEVTAIQVGASGEAVFGTETGLLVFTPPIGEREPVRIATPPVTSLAFADGGGVWVGTREGLFHLPEGSFSATRLGGLPEGVVTALLAEPGRPLVAAVLRGGLFELDGGKWRNLDPRDEVGKKIGTIVAATRSPFDAGVWIGTTDRGAFRRDGDRFVPFGEREGLPGPTVLSIFEDQEGVLWFGCEGGLVKRAPSPFVAWDRADGLEEETNFFGLAESADGTVWASSQGGLFELPPGGRWRLHPFRLDGETIAINDVADAGDGTLWLATTRGLARWAAGKIALVDVGLEPTTRSVLSVVALPGGGVAFGTRRDGLQIWRGGKLVRAGPPVGNSISSVVVGPDGRLLAAGYGWGVAEVELDGTARFRVPPESLPTVNVNYASYDSSNRLWVATERGAVVFPASGAREVWDRRAGLPGDFVYWVGDDRDGNIWFGTNHGAARRGPDGRIEVYGSRDGLPVDECNDDGFLATRDGRVILASTGLARFVGRRRAMAGPPVVKIESLIASGTAFPETVVPLLPPRPGPVRIDFAALSFTDESRIRFRWRLLGFSEEWIDAPAGQFQAVLGPLPAGDYVFEVTAETADGRVADPPARREFSIRPFWWETARARFAAGALLLASALLVLRRWLGRVERAHRALERQVRERTAELERANAQLERMAVTDDLTGLPNRRRILERLAEGLAYARRRGTPLSILLVDLDHFKAVNDTLGHAAGDDLLRAAASAISSSLREVDAVGRYGGEEFLVVFPGEDLDGALRAAERVRAAVADALAVHPIGEKAPRPPTLSGGVATLTPAVADLAELIHRADEALYVAKGAGRNRIESWVRPA